MALPDIYHEQEAPGSCLEYDGPGADRGNALKVGKPMDAYDTDAATAIDYLQRHPCSTGKVTSSPACLMCPAGTNTRMVWGGRCAVGVLSRKTPNTCTSRRRGT